MGKWCPSIMCRLGSGSARLVLSLHHRHMEDCLAHSYAMSAETSSLEESLKEPRVFLAAEAGKKVPWLLNKSVRRSQSKVP